MGMPPEDYAKRLLEDELALQREAEKMTFAEIMAPVRQDAGTVEEAEIVKLVDKARTAHYRGEGRTEQKEITLPDSSLRLVVRTRMCCSPVWRPNHRHPRRLLMPSRLETPSR